MLALWNDPIQPTELAAIEQALPGCEIGFMH